MSSGDPFADVNAEQVEMKPSPKKKGRVFKQAAAGVSRLDTQVATGTNTGMHGQYKQANFKLRPEVVDQIDEWARRLGVNKSQLKRYLAWRGLQALEDGERPEYSGENVQRDLVEY